MFWRFAQVRSARACLISAACTNIVLDSMTQLAVLCMQLNLVSRMAAERITFASCLMMKWLAGCFGLEAPRLVRGDTVWLLKSQICFPWLVQNALTWAVCLSCLWAAAHTSFFFYQFAWIFLFFLFTPAGPLCREKLFPENSLSLRKNQDVTALFAVHVLTWWGIPQAGGSARILSLLSWLMLIVGLS